MMLAQPSSFGSLFSSQSKTVCMRCMRKLVRPQSGDRRSFSVTNVRRSTASQPLRSASSLGKEYFWTNRRDDAFFSVTAHELNARGAQKSFASGEKVEVDQATPTKAAPIKSSDQRGQESVYTRGRRRKPKGPSEDPASIPLDASSQLVTASTAAPPSSLRRKLALFLSLTKPRLTFLVVLTAATPYGLYPIPDLLSTATTAAPSLSAATLLFLTSGTFLASASANTFNMLLEPQYDAKMSRTRNRPLVRKLISSRAAAIFGLVTGVSGVAILYFGCNPTTSMLGAANILLYAAVYTPMKRISTINTWVGALVGALPPLMGWTAAAGQYSSHGDWRELLFGAQAEGGWLLAALLFAWQFPHFNALSHTIRDEYAAAGYRMLCSLNPARNARVALRYSLLMFPVSVGLLACGVVGGPTLSSPTTLLWLAGSSAINGWMAAAATRFWWHRGAKATARGLFWASVWHLPILLVMAMALKRGMWAGLAESIGLTPSEDDDEDDMLLTEPSAQEGVVV